MPLSVLSYNVWGIFLSKHLDERMKLIGKRLREYDVVCLQEQFEQRHCNMLFPDRGIFPHIERYVSCEYGSGLTIASKYPIVAAMFLPFRACGRAEAIWEGDYIANKGIAAVRIAVPNSVLLGDNNNNSANASAAAAASSSTSVSSPRPGVDNDTTEVVILNSHFVAQYESYSKIGGFYNESNAASRLTEAYQMADFICLLHGTSSQRTPIIVCGDLNAGHDSHEVTLLHDYCIQRGIHLQPAISPHDKNNFSYTTDNTFVGVSANEALPIQLDHIIYGDLALQSAGKVVFKEKVKLSTGETVQDKKSDNKNSDDADSSDKNTNKNDDDIVHLSDHFGVAAVFSHIEPIIEPAEAIETAKHQTEEVAKFLKKSGDKYNWHFKMMIAAAILIFGVAAAGWATKHPFAVASAGALSAFLLFISIGHRRHESEYYYEVAGKVTNRKC